MERAELCEEMAGERDDDQGGGNKDEVKGEGEGWGTLLNGGGIIQGHGGGSGVVILSLLLKRPQ